MNHRVVIYCAANVGVVRFNSEQAVRPVVGPPQNAPAPCKWWLEQPLGAFSLEVTAPVGDAGHRIPSVLYCIVLYINFLKWPKYKPQGPLDINILNILSLKFVGLPVPKIWLIRPSVLDLESGTGQTDGRTDNGRQCIMRPPYGAGHNNIERIIISSVARFLCGDRSLTFSTCLVHV